MTPEKFIVIFACVALALTIITITLLVVDAYFLNGKFTRRRKRKPVKSSSPMPRMSKVRRPAPSYGAARVRNGAAIGVLGGLLSGVLVAVSPFVGRKGRCCPCCGVGRCKCGGRRRGVRTYRF